MNIKENSKIPSIFYKFPINYMKKSSHFIYIIFTLDYML